MPRRPDRQVNIAGHLRKTIVSGQLQPGDRLPIRRVVEQKYDASPVTVQHAFDRLERDGFIRSRGRHGCFVSDLPPHLFSYWLVFTHDIPPGVSPFRDALIAAAERVTRRGRETFLVYAGQNGHPEEGNYRRLLYDVETQRTAGIIFASDAGYWSRSPLLSRHGVARVAIGHSPNVRSNMGISKLGVGAVRENGGVAEGQIQDMPLVALDRYSFLDKALDCLARRKRSRVAVIAPSAILAPPCLEYLRKAAVARGLRLEPCGVQFASLHDACSARNLAHLLLSGAPRRRPNGLIVMDDSFVPHAAAGARDAGLALPDDLLLIAHTNFPYPAAAPAPVIRLGYDIPALLQTCLRVLVAQRRNGPRPPDVSVSAFLEEEIVRNNQNNRA